MTNANARILQETRILTAREMIVFGAIVTQDDEHYIVRFTERPCGLYRHCAVTASGTIIATSETRSRLDEVLREGLRLR